MFNISNWLKENLMKGYQNQAFAKEYVAIMATNYLIKGLLNENQIEEIAKETASETTTEMTDEESQLI